MSVKISQTKLSTYTEKLACDLAAQVLAELRNPNAQVWYEMEALDGTKIAVVVAIGNAAVSLNEFRQRGGLRLGSECIRD